MSDEAAAAAPVLSTPATHILDEDLNDVSVATTEKLTDEQLCIRYEIKYTIDEIKANRWQKVALQFPDDMLPHSARVYQLLASGLRSDSASTGADSSSDAVTSGSSLKNEVSKLNLDPANEVVKLTILADTSYGSCCVDEVAAEHVNADAVVHYGRSCLSPTARLPVLYIYTKRDLDHAKVLAAFQEAFPDRNAQVIVTADVPCSDHVQSITSQLHHLGYERLFAATIIHDPTSAIPNRTIPDSVSSSASTLKDWALFHISAPPTSLLLSLTSTLSTIHIFPTSEIPIPNASATSRLLRRRYALVTSLTTVAVWGILINTLSVSNYLSMVTHIQSLLSAASKKSYLFVVGKINVAKLSNFAEIGGWVVVGCWESSLIDSKDFYRPIITPFELELVLKPDEDRVWTGEWRGDFESVLRKSDEDKTKTSTWMSSRANGVENQDGEEIANGNASDEESDEAPEFDLRTGKYVSRTRPIGKKQIANGSDRGSAQSTALAKRANGDIVAVNGVVSPAAQYLTEKRTWKGLGSDFEIQYEQDQEEEEQGSLIEEGRTGIASGYSVGESERT